VRNFDIESFADGLGSEGFAQSEVLTFEYGLLLIYLRNYSGGITYL